MSGRARVSVPALQRRVLRWFQEHGRSFPWRDHRDPYATMVAETMLQQTQTGRVAPSYVAFLQQFPTVSSLAHASAMEVIRAWKGLGYNRRAANLQRAAQEIERDHAGVVPPHPRTLRTLPGLGAYSASAIACFAFDAQIPVIDVNVERVLARAALGRDSAEASKDRIERTARAWLPPEEAYRWNQALMDVGATICRTERPLCAQCPLRAACGYRAKGRHRMPPVRPRKNAEPFLGSRRQKRGDVVDALREAAAGGVTLRALERVLHPKRNEHDLTWLVELLEGLERDRLVVLSDAARRGSPRGRVRLPS